MTGPSVKWRSYAAGAGAILLFCLLLILRLDVPERLRRGGESLVRAGVGIPAGSAWMNITQGGRKIGYLERTYARTEEGFDFSENIFMRINTMGIVQPLSLRTAARLNPDRTLSSLQFDLTSNLFAFTVRGAVTGKKLTVRVGAPGEEKTTIIDLPEPLFLGGGILESVGAEGLRPGETRTLPVFEPASLGQRSTRVSLLGEETVIIMGEGRPARKVSVDFLGMKQIAWVGLDGSVLREEGALGIVLERVTREEALAGIEGAASEDLTELAAVPSRITIGDAAALRLLRIRLEGLPEGAFFLDGGRQAYRDGIMTVRREPSSAVPAVSDRGADDPGAGNPRAALGPTPFIESDHPKIRGKAAEIIVSGDPDSVKGEKLMAWVHGNLQKRPVLSVPRASEILENRVGDCNEHAVLLAALARAAGIPAEIEAGLVYMRGRFFYHAWNVIYLRDKGGWTTADAALGQMPADVTHIRFVRGGADRQLDLAGLIGKVKVDILEMER